MELTIGPGLVTLAQNGDLLTQISAVRTQIAHELGMLLPKMRIKDNLRAEPFTYELKLRGIPVASGEAHRSVAGRSDVVRRGRTRWPTHHRSCNRSAGGLD